MRKETELVRLAEKEAKTAPSWADFSNFLYDQQTGILVKVFPDEKARRAFLKTPQYKRIRELMAEVRARTGLADGATPSRKSGRFLVRVPQSLHAALQVEAKREGVSLNQLVVAKLAFQLGSIVGK
jgi:predicted HicB family RNase H-like nuclease